MLYAMFFGIWLVGTLSGSSALASEATLQSADQVSEIIALHNLAPSHDAISGKVVNHSTELIKDIVLLIRYNWLWRNEFRPGVEPPGRAVFYELKKEVPPGASVPFAYSPSPPLPSRSDGSFQIEVSVAEFLSVAPQ